jgi:hypothetical protein
MKFGFYVSFIALFLELIIKSVLIYQESYWGWDDQYNIFIFRYIVKIPVFIILISVFISLLSGKNIDRLTQIITGVLILFAVFLFVKIINNWKDPLLHQFNISNLFLIGDYGYFFLIGFFITMGNDLIYRVKSMIISGQLLITLQIILFFNFSTLSIDIENLHHNSYIHLLLGNSYAVWSVFTMSAARNNQRFAIYLLCLPFIFFCSSRTAFYCFLFLFPLLVYSTNKRYFKYLFIGLSIFIITLVFNPLSIREFRMFAIFSGNDLSLAERIDTIRTTFPDMIKNIISGDYGGFYRYPPPANTYIHNIFSFWSQFGLIPFIMVIILSSLVLLEAKNHVLTLDKSLSFIIVMLTVYILLGMIFSKSFTYPHFFILFGFIGYSCRNHFFNAKPIIYSD